MLIQNNYPEKLIRQKISKVLSNSRPVSQEPSSQIPSSQTSPTLSSEQAIAEKKFYKSFPYVKGMSENIEKVLKKDVNNVKLAFKPTESLGNTCFSKLKDKVEIMDAINCIYNIPCLNCEKSYIGQTKNQLHKRITQHKGDLENVENKIGKTAIVSHFLNFERANVLEIKRNLKKRLVKESFNIHIVYSVDSHNTFNERRDTEIISSVYYCVLISG